MTDCFIYDAVRTPRGKGRKKDGSLSPTRLRFSMAKAVLQALPDRGGFDNKEIEDVIFGCVEPVGEQGANVGRMAAMIAGIRRQRSRRPAQQVLFVRASKQQISAAAKVKAGDVDLVVGGGVESMSRIVDGSRPEELGRYRPRASDGVPRSCRKALAPIWSLPNTDIAARTSTRLQSRARSERCRRVGRRPFQPSRSFQSRTSIGVTMLDRDEHMRPGTDRLGTSRSSKPSFEMMGQNFGFNAVAIQKYPEVEQITHVHHAGNSSGIVDGSSAVLLGNKEAGERLGLKPRARVVKSATVGSEPCIMLTGPGPATRKVLGKAGMQTSDVDLWEINEAFASVCLLFMDEMGIDHSVTNVNGGAIAFGHPLGATGAMLVGTMLDELERRDLNTALITLCVGAGMGTSTIIERV